MFWDSASINLAVTSQEDPGPVVALDEVRRKPDRGVEERLVAKRHAPPLVELIELRGRADADKRLNETVLVADIGAGRALMAVGIETRRRRSSVAVMTLAKPAVEATA